MENERLCQEKLLERPVAPGWILDRSCFRKLKFTYRACAGCVVFVQLSSSSSSLLQKDRS